MAGVRRRLRDITTRVSGALAGPRDEGAVGSGGPPEELPVDENAWGGPDAGHDAFRLVAAAGPVEQDGPVDISAGPIAAALAVPEPAQPDAAAAAQPVTGPAVTPDPVCAAAVELARAVAVEAGGSSVGGHLGVEADDALVVTHSFASTDRAYRGWRWAVTVARAEGSEQVTVDEVVLLPGVGALLAPEWVPWSERVQPGDLAAGDLLPPQPDDPRLVPSYADPEAELATEVFWELGLGRPRVLSVDGRLQAAERWYDGSQGPSAGIAKQAPGQCAGCGFLLAMAGGMRALFGVCGNALAPDDGRVVSLDHGCGAHSETAVELTHVAPAGLVVEHDELELVPGGGQPAGRTADHGDSRPKAVGSDIDPADETPDGHAS